MITHKKPSVIIGGDHSQTGPVRETAKKGSFFLVDSPLRGRGVRGCTLRIFFLFFLPLSQGGGG